MYYSLHPGWVGLRGSTPWGVLDGRERRLCKVQTLTIIASNRVFYKKLEEGALQDKL